ncbi:VCBS repeat-containing protein [Zobellia uliginosa]|uniref:VCBS repeat-containing protein n=1 Tax=Zobellia uliginosa TaxID=143224 RepID=UPI001C07741D|nr:VCBS repeat-containing protein [Zobellia uliginosa]MBU2945737.1 VCBS repeat-containing protein [Zobellia uliginosa]
MKNFRTLITLCITILVGCNKPKENTLFKILPSNETNLTFSNDIIENDSVNILTYEYIYNGGGVGIGDFNNDGLPDIYLTGNMVDNKLYLNQGKLKFSDVTKISKVEAINKWSTGVTTVDINNDGWLDIYVNSSGPYNFYNKQNLFFINQGIDKKGIPVFEEKGAEYGLDDDGPSVHAAFLDYDQDGDLDVYLLNNIQKNDVSANSIVPKKNDGTSVNNDKLYKNNFIETGEIFFSDVTIEAGIIKEGYGLGLAIQDMNLDGWPDIYVSNDYISNDILYINNKNGTFTDQISSMFKHQSHSAMGNDIADINNDGLVDVITLDMLPRENKGRKLMLQGIRYERNLYKEQYNYDPQYVRNTLQLNQGNSESGLPIFSEIGQFSGVSESNWSWSPLMIDLDNDGNRDLFIANGYPKDITNSDYSDYRNEGGRLLFKSYVDQNRELLELLDTYPSLKVPNKIFKNNGDLTFADVSEKWGVIDSTFSQGAAFADFDNDGDLDIVVNNINDKVQFLENTLYPISNKDSTTRNNFLKVKLKGPTNNLSGIGTKIYIKTKERMQYYEQSPYRGFQSTVEDIIHFGVGSTKLVDTLEVVWADGKSQLLEMINGNQKLELSYKNANLPKLKNSDSISLTNTKPLFKNVTDSLNLTYLHKEKVYIDFLNQPLLPHMHSQSGPGIAIGDINGDNLEDFFVGGSFGHSGKLFTQKTDGTFLGIPITDGRKYEEDMGCLLFDADNDDDLDLYIVSGSTEFKSGSDYYKDRLYINDGNSNFKLDTNALPELAESGSNVIAADYDGDGDLDLFVGGRIKPNSYPYPSRSAILRNDSQKKDCPVFVDVTHDVAPEMEDLGMVTTSLWTDFNNDGKLDLLLAGEWMPPTFFQNTGNKFINITTKITGMNNHTGWWNSFVGADFDNDGDIDYIGGNLGLNSKLKASTEFPLLIYVNDFDGNGSIDPIVAFEQDGSYYPLPSRNEIAEQLVMMKKRFKNHTTYAESKLSQVLTKEEVEESLQMNAKYFASAYFENQGTDKDGIPSFKVKSLPYIAQFAPVNGMLVQDVDENGTLDLTLIGNSYQTNATLGRYDALNGLFFSGDGEGNFNALNFKETGFSVQNDSRSLAELICKNGKSLFLASQNNNNLKAYLQTTSSFKIYKAEKMNSFALITLNDGRTRKHEFYYGQSYLSQSSRILKYNPLNVKQITIYNFNGGKKALLKH